MSLGGTSASVHGNVITENANTGAEIDLQPGISFGTFNHNSLVSNGVAGVNVKMAGTFTGPVTVTLDHDDHFGNGEPAAGNCGLEGTDTDINANTLTINTSLDFWGKPTGPRLTRRISPGACNTGPATVSATPFLASEPVILPPTIR